jgi:hypothetical protein
MPSRCAAEGAREAERKAPKITANRAGFDDLDAWLARQPAIAGAGDTGW